MDWFAWDFDHPAYFQIYADKDAEAAAEGPALAALLDLPPGSRVLDLPCGWGRLQPHLVARGWETLGGDLSRMNLDRHRKDHPATLARLDLRALPFRAGCADGVFCAYTSWGYFATDAENLRQLAEFARVLRPGGALLLDLAGRSSLRRTIAEVEGQWLEFPDEGYEERATWSPDGRRIRTERRCQGEAFRHDIWIPTDTEVRTSLAAAGFEVVAAYGGLDGRSWSEDAERWIYRGVRR
ncbi:class I SAM-dependent methyltransferase [Geothrix alkalitolerans]|uniref:class I SAM-dependent methyltransferase n=1 Tax=Geothrix alkalitolerans TaxID=2922724 RepID=UPI001FAFC701|nr:class I SAM-dependent methyltransferase [Geothrix alkalitolerans]